MKRLFILFISIVLYGNTFAQEPDVCPFTVTGTVIDEHDRQPLVNALLKIKETGASAWSDSLGKFTFPSVCHGTYTITCIHPGCDTLTKTIEVTGNTVVNFEPEHHAEMLKQVNIMALQTIVLIDPGLEAGTLRGKDLARIKSSSMADMIKTIPGVVTQTTGSTISKPVIHGMEGNRLLLVNNGVPLEAQQWGSEHAPEIDPLAAGNIKVIKGAGTLRYGLGAIGGVIEVNPRPVYSSYVLGGEYFTSISSNGLQFINSALLEGRLKKHTQWFARAQGSYTRGGNIRAPGYYINNTGINNYNYALSTGYAGDKTNVQVSHSRVKSELGIFTGSHVENLTDLLTAFNQSQSTPDTTSFTYAIDHPYQHILHETSRISVFQRLNWHNNILLMYARQFNHRQEFDAHGHAHEGEKEHAALDMMATTHYAKAAWVRTKKTTWEAGVNGTLKRNTWEGRFLIPNYQSKQGGVYSLCEGKIWDRIQYSAGGRYDVYQMESWLWQDTVLSNPQFDFSGLSAQLSLKYPINYHFDVSLNTGMSWRPPAVNELFSNGLHHGAAAYETGDVNLKKENVLHADITATRSNTRINGMLSVYADRFTDFIYLQPNLQPVLTVQGAFPSFSFMQGNALVTGIDGMLEYKMREKFYLLVNGSALRGYNLTTSDYLPFMPANRFGYGLKYEKKTYSARMYNVFFSVNNQHVTKQKHIQQNGDYVPAPEGYMLLSCQTGFQLKVKNQFIDISLQGNNLLNKKYRDYLNRFRYYTDEAGINFILRVSVPFALITIKPEKTYDYLIE